MNTDADLQCEIVESIVNALGRDVAQVGIVVKDGVATLNGYVCSLTEKWLAEYIVLSVYGVRSIANWIEIWQPSAGQERAANSAGRASRAART